MSKSKHGFTLIEVALFLAVSAALFVGVMAGMQGAISEQEKNDAVQNFAEFLRSAYSEAENVQNLTTGGRSEKAIYGKLITFGESTNLLGGTNTDREIFMYTVVGNVSNASSGGKTTLEMLEKLKVGVMEKTGDSKLQFMGIAEGYKMRWETYLQPKCKVEMEGGKEVVKTCEGTYTDFKGSILIARQPNTGTMFTYYSPQVIQVNETIKNYVAGSSTNNLPMVSGSTEGNYLTENGFEMTQVDFCINVSGAENGAERTDVRIVEGASNASAIEIVGSEKSLCSTH